jgi:SAM-dependent methyltransferase
MIFYEFRNTIREMRKKPMTGTSSAGVFMDTDHGRIHQKMPDGTTLAEALYRAMQRIEKTGVHYPDGYCRTILELYSRENLPYPYIVQHMGDARIRKHFLYPGIFRKPGDLLDYGCGTGDAIRQLIRDGYPPEKLLGFDISDASLRLGYDLYLDRDRMETHFITFPVFPCPRERYDRVYSGSVIHVLGDEREFSDYIHNAYRTLKPGGIFFGSTLGLADSAAERPERGPPRLMRQQELAAAMEQGGFSGIRIVEEERPDLTRAGRGMCVFQFSAEKKS